MEETRILAIVNPVRQELATSAEYLNYKKTLEELKDHPELLTKVREFSKRRMEVEEEPEILEEVTKEQEMLFHTDPVVERFLEAEEEYCSLLRHLDRIFWETAFLEADLWEETP